MKAYQRAKEKSVYYDEECVSAAIREIANCFEWDSYGLAELNADDFIELADELEAL